MTGIDYPTVTIGGRTLTVKFSFAAQRLMQRRGIDVQHWPSSICPRKHADGVGCADMACSKEHSDNPAAEDNLMKVFACLVVHEFVDLSSPTLVSLDEAPSGDYWAAMVDSQSDLQAIATGVWLALGKALGVKPTKLQAVPPPATESLAS